MKTKLVTMLVMLGAMTAVAAPPPPKGGPGPGPMAGPGPGPRGGGWNDDDDDRAERQEARAKKAHLFYVVAISEALDLSDADALKLSDRMKGVEEKRRPLRQQMGEAMRSLRDAAQGDQAALGQVDANVQKVLDGRAQMAALDKELFATLSQGYSPQQRAKLALVLARLHQELKGGPGKKGRR